MITKEMAIELGNKGYGEIHGSWCQKIIGPRGGIKLKIYRWRVNGKCKLWKTMPDRFQLPIKHGFYGPYYYVTEQNAHAYHVESECPLLQAPCATISQPLDLTLPLCYVAAPATHIAYQWRTAYVLTKWYLSKCW